MKHLLTLTAATLTCGATFGQNDDCTGATALTADVAVMFDTTAATAGTPFDCAGDGGPDLWFSYTTQGADNNVTVELCGSTYDTALEVFEGTCNALTLVGCNDDSCGLQSSLTFAGGAAGTTYLFRAGGFSGATGVGTVLVTEETSTCGTPDMFEDSDDCASAHALGDGFYDGLNVEELDNDYYEIVVEDGATLTADIFFVDDIADVDLYLWDPLVACDTNVAGPGAGTGALAVGFSATDDEQVVYTNMTGAAQTLIVEVDMFTAGGCNTYSLMLDGTSDGPSTIGTNYCMANPNSTGAAGMMAATGSDTASDNDVTLWATRLPADVNGYFITSMTQGFVANPKGSDGNLCLGGTIGRYLGPGQAQNSGAGGEFSLTIDLTETPLSMGFGSIAAGETWHYQAWHRDDSLPGGNASSNFTDGLSIMYQ